MCVHVHIFISHIVLPDIYLPGIYFWAPVVYVFLDQWNVFFVF